MTPKLTKTVKVKRRCQWLDPNGKRCGRNSIGTFYLHENPEHSQGLGGSWFIVHLCELHEGGRTVPNRRSHEGKKEEGQ